MIWALVAVFAVLLVLMVLVQGREQVPWMNRLRRVRAGVAHQGEWIAPDDVTKTVRSDFLAAIDWMYHHVAAEHPDAVTEAVRYLTADCLSRYISWHYQLQSRRLSRFVGVLYSTHCVDVRHFSDDGSQCLVVDYQTNRRMITSDRRSGVRLPPQDLGDSAVVYRMMYDRTSRRWKIAGFVQELPMDWVTDSPRPIKLLSTLPATAGRDH